MRRKYHDCPTCNKSIFGDAKYCSDQCRDKANVPTPRRRGKTVACEWCGEKFYLPLSRLKRAKHFFCCLEHQIEWQGRNKPEFTCKICGERFVLSPSLAKQHNPTYCSLACRDADPERSEMLREMNARQQELSPNKLELRAYALLDELPIEYEKQVMIADKFCVDAFIPEHDIIIQIDGDYWHANPAKYTELDHRQQKRVNIDRSQNAYFAKCGYTVLRFWGSDIRKRPEWVSGRVMQSVLSPGA